MSLIIYIFRYFIRGTALLCIAGPMAILLIGYTRDAVRMYNARVIVSAVELTYYAQKNDPEKYPKRLEDISGSGKILPTIPTDPIHAVDLNAINTILQSLGVPDSIVDSNVTDKNGYRFVYNTTGDQKMYEISTRLESIFLAKKMQEDSGDDSLRYELGNNLKISPKLSTNKEKRGATEAQEKSLDKIKKLGESLQKLRGK